MFVIQNTATKSIVANKNMLVHDIHSARKFSLEHRAEAAKRKVEKIFGTTLGDWVVVPVEKAVTRI